MTEAAHVIIVGSGVAGSFLANYFAAQRISGVLMLEAGPAVPMADPKWWFHNVAAGGGTENTPYAACYDEKGDFYATGNEPWDIVGGRIFGGGGTTLHWGGWTPRFKPEDFALRANAAHSHALDWPFTYHDLEPYYCQAEQYLAVSGDSDDNNPPRSEPYPFRPAPFPISAGPFIDAFDQMGISYSHMPVARNGGFCRTTGTCDYCPIGGRFTGDQPLGRAQSNPGVLVRFNAPAVKIRMANKQRVAGVTYLDRSSGRMVDVDADVVILCNGAIETPKLLLASQNPYWPNGIGNDNDLVGRFISATQFFFASGQMGNPRGFEKELGFPSLCSRQFDTPAQQRKGKLFLSMNYAEPNLDIAASMAEGVDYDGIMQKRVAPNQFQLYGNMSCIPQYENRVAPLSGTNRFDLPRTLIDTPAPLYDPQSAQEYRSLMENVLCRMGCTGVQSGTYPQRGDHAACTTRMARDPADGVVDTDLGVFGTDNLFIVGNSVLPSLPAANPTLTLVALMFKVLSDSQSALRRLTRP